MKSALHNSVRLIKEVIWIYMYNLLGLSDKAIDMCSENMVQVAKSMSLTRKDATIAK